MNSKLLQKSKKVILGEKKNAKKHDVVGVKACYTSLTSPINTYWDKCEKKESKNPGCSLQSTEKFCSGTFNRERDV